jgi:hypothetical protein
LISEPAEAIGPAIHEGKEGEQHAEDLGLMDALRGRAKAHFAERFNCKKGRLLNELTAKSGRRVLLLASLDRDLIERIAPDANRS